MDNLEAIERLAQLRDSGALTEEEFQEQKRLVISGPQRDVALQDRYDPRLQLEYDASKKSVWVAYLLWLLLFPVSAHRFYLHKWKTAFLQIILGGAAIFGVFGGALLGLLLGSRELVGVSALIGL